MMSFSDQYITLPETNSKFAPENGWLEDELVSCLAHPIFRCEVLVSGRVVLLELTEDKRKGVQIYEKIQPEDPKASEVFDQKGA